MAKPEISPKMFQHFMNCRNINETLNIYTHLELEELENVRWELDGDRTHGEKVDIVENIQGI